MKPFELRLAQEHIKIARHSRNIDAFIADDSRFGRIPPEQRPLMRRQAQILREYVAILEQRMSLLNIPV